MPAPSIALRATSAARRRGPRTPDAGASDSGELTSRSALGTRPIPLARGGRPRLGGAPLLGGGRCLRLGSAWVGDDRLRGRDHVLSRGDLADDALANAFGEVAGGAMRGRRERSQLRLLGHAPFGLAELLEEPAPGMEPTAGGRCGGRRDIALEDDEVLPD